MSAVAQTTILVVDDDRAMCKLIEDFLARGGYATLSADSGEAALQVFEEHRANIALLVTDVTMPGIDGLELARRVQRIKPELPVLVVSACSGRLSEHKDFAFLPKPFVAPDLLSQIRKILPQRKGTASEEAAKERKLKSG